MTVQGASGTLQPAPGGSRFGGGSADAIERRSQAARAAHDLPAPATSLADLADARRAAAARSTAAHAALDKLQSSRPSPLVRAERDQVRTETARLDGVTEQALHDEIVQARLTLSPSLAERYEQDLAREFEQTPHLRDSLVRVQQRLDQAAASAPDFDAALAEIRAKDLPEYQVLALQDQVLDFEARHGSAAAQELVARYVAADPQAFADGYAVLATWGVGALQPRADALYAQGLGMALERVAPERGGRAYWAGRLVQGALDAGDPNAYNHVAELIARSGNDQLQTAYVTAGLNWVSRTAPSLQPGFDRSVTSFAGSLGLAVGDSRQAAQAVIRFAESHVLGANEDDLEPPGVESMRWLLNRFAEVHDADTGCSALVSFLDAALPADTAAGRTSPAARLGRHESLTLFLALGGDDGLLAEGSPDSDTRVMEQTSLLFQTSLTDWVADPTLGFMVGPDISEGRVSGTRYADVDISKTLSNFFGEALVDRDRDGAYRDELLGFVTGTVFDTFDPNGGIAKALAANGSVESGSAGQFGGNLLGILKNAQVDIYGQIAAASDEKRRLYTLLYVTGISAAGGLLGATVGGVGASAVLTKAAVAALTELAKTGGRFTIDDLMRRGVDAETAQIIVDFVQHRGTAADAFNASGLAERLRGSGLSGADFATVERRLEAALSSGNTFGKSLEEVADIVDNLVPDAAGQEAVDDWLEQLNAGVRAQTPG